MAQPTGSARHTRPTVAVTGAAGALGAAVLQQLAAAPEPGRLVAVDSARPPDGDDGRADVAWRTADVRDPTLPVALADVDTVVHLATDRTLLADPAQRRAVNVRGTRNVLDAAATAGARRVVLVTSAAVYGAAADNELPLSDDAPLLGLGATRPAGRGRDGRAGGGTGEGLVGDWLAVERAALDSPLQVTVLRPASLVGAVSDALLPGLFEAVRLLAIREGRCLWQFCHTDDLVDAISVAAVGWVSGGVTVGCEGWLERADVERISGLRTAVLPASVAAATASRLHRIGALRSPASDLDYLTHPWVVGSTRLRETGWRPTWTNEAALREHLRLLGDRAGKGFVVVDRKDATRAAAGVTLAALGSFALARARRR